MFSHFCIFNLVGHGFLGCLPVISVVGQGHNEQRAPEYQVGHRDHYEHLHLTVMIMMNIIMMMSRMMFEDGDSVSKECDLTSTNKISILTFIFINILLIHPDMPCLSICRKLAVHHHHHHHHHHPHHRPQDQHKYALPLQLPDLAHHYCPHHLHHHLLRHHDHDQPTLDMPCLSSCRI